jgi:hypothetical protein
MLRSRPCWAQAIELLEKNALPGQQVAPHRGYLRIGEMRNIDTLDRDDACADAGMMALQIRNEV